MPLDRSIGNYFDSSGSFIRRVARWTGPASYVAGGEVATAATFGMGRIVAILFGNMTDAAGSGFRVPVYNPTTGKIMVFAATGGAEISGGTDLSTFSGSIEVIGT